MSKRLDFETIVPAAAAGNKAALDALMTGFYDWSISVVRLLGAEEELARNIATEFWALVYADSGALLRRYRSTGSFFRWFRTVLRNFAVDHLRNQNTKRRRQPQMLTLDEVPRELMTDAGETLGNAVATELQGLMLEALNDRERRFFQYLLDGVSAKEIAFHESLTPGYTRTLIARVRRKTRRAIQ